MISAQLKPTTDDVENEGLIELLSQADEALAHLRERADHIFALGDLVSLGFCPRQMKTLCGILDHGRGRIRRRLSILSSAAEAPDEAMQSDPPPNISDPIAFMAEYRACCRLLCKALSEALRVANTPSVSMLSDFILRLEKQLWLMDTPKNDPGSDRYRSVSLFLTC